MFLVCACSYRFIFCFLFFQDSVLKCDMCSLHIDMHPSKCFTCTHLICDHYTIRCFTSNRLRNISEKTDAPALQLPCFRIQMLCFSALDLRSQAAGPSLQTFSTMGRCSTRPREWMPNQLYSTPLSSKQVKPLSRAQGKPLNRTPRDMWLWSHNLSQKGLSHILSQNCCVMWLETIQHAARLND